MMVIVYDPKVGMARRPSARYPKKTLPVSTVSAGGNTAFGFGITTMGVADNSVVVVAILPAREAYHCLKADIP